MIIRSLLLPAALLVVACDAVIAKAGLDPITQSILEEDPDFSYFAAIVVAKGTGFQEARALGLAKYSVFDFAGAVFTRAPASEILSWQSRPEVLAVDVIDETAAHTLFRVMTQLQAVVRYDDLGVLRPNVVNISMGPVRALVGKSGSGEHAIQAALRDVVGRHRIPVVMSAGNDGPGTGTINPWTEDTDVLVVGATDSAGLTLFERSSRAAAPAPQRPPMFVAEGIDTLGPRAGCRPKTKEDLEEDELGHLSARVGRGNEACWEIKSGTSFAAGIVTRTICLAHQSLSALRTMGDPSTAAGSPIALPAFVRSYIDFDFDRNLKVFENRLADARMHFGPLSIAFPLALRRTYIDVVMKTSMDLDLNYGPDSLLAMLKAVAKPVPGRGAQDVGSGFVSFDNLANALRALHLSGLITMLAPGDPRAKTWIDQARNAGDPLVLPPEVIEPIVDYCNDNDLILGLPVSED